MRKRSGQATARRGSVLLEYVVLTSVVILTLTGATELFIDLDAVPLSEWEQQAIFSGTAPLDPEGYDQDDIDAGLARFDYGLLGNEFVDWYRRLATGIALPFP